MSPGPGAAGHGQGPRGPAGFQAGGGLFRWREIPTGMRAMEPTRGRMQTTPQEALIGLTKGPRSDLGNRRGRDQVESMRVLMEARERRVGNRAWFAFTSGVATSTIGRGSTFVCRGALGSRCMRRALSHVTWEDTPSQDVMGRGQALGIACFSPGHRSIRFRRARLGLNCLRR